MSQACHVTMSQAGLDNTEINKQLMLIFPTHTHKTPEVDLVLTESVQNQYVYHSSGSF